MQRMTGYDGVIIPLSRVQQSKGARAPPKQGRAMGRAKSGHTGTLPEYLRVSAVLYCSKDQTKLKNLQIMYSPESFSHKILY